MKAVARWLEIELARIREQILEAEATTTSMGRRTFPVAEQYVGHAASRNDIARAQWLRFVTGDLRSGRLSDKQLRKIIEGATGCPAWMSLPEVTDEDRARIKLLVLEVTEGARHGGEPQLAK